MCYFLCLGQIYEGYENMASRDLGAGEPGCLLVLFEELTFTKIFEASFPEDRNCIAARYSLDGHIQIYIYKEQKGVCNKRPKTHAQKIQASSQRREKRSSGRRTGRASIESNACLKSVVCILGRSHVRIVKCKTHQCFFPIRWRRVAES